MKQLRKAILFTFCCLLLTFASQGKELPSIRPVPCTNHMTGESGVCTFNWSCINVAHGVHIGPCVDRFFIGTCCKIPSDDKEFGAKRSSDYGATQTTPKVDQVASALHHTLASETAEEKVKKTVSTINVGHANVTFTPLGYFGVAHNVTSVTDSYHQSHETEIAFDNKLKVPQGAVNWNHSPPSPNKRPLLTELFFQTLFFSHKNPLGTNKETSKENQELNTSTYEILTESHSSGRSPSDFEISNHLSTLAGVLNTKTNAVTESSHNLRKPVIVHETHNQRKPVLLNEEHDLRKPAPLDEDHDQRWPVIEEDSHDQRLPVVKWTGSPDDENRYSSWFERKGSISTTTKNVFRTSELLTTDVNLNTEPSQNLFPHFGGSYSSDATSNAPLLFTTSNALETSGSAYSSNTISPDFAHVQPTFSWSSLKPPSSFLERNPTSFQETNFKDLSRVCGRSGSSTTARIVGGRKSHYLRWPWMISLRRFEGKSYKHKCGAALLNQIWAVTAAHCVDGKLPVDIMLRLGEYNFGRSDELHPHVERRVYVMVIHPQFNHITYENDLALLRFDEPVELRANIIPICLPYSMDDITGRMAVVTGWGRLSEEGELPAALHEVQMPILSNEECEQMFYEAGYSESIREVFVCAGLPSGGLDACEGDSGGPMVVRGDQGQWILVGLISWGMGCAAPKQPGVYTRMSLFSDWIDGIISH